ncbi:MAG: coenzyme A pyrophosphatase [Fusobacteriia bacterium 4572_74]|nr:MAG: coenzyme A pyrophosphatase [Fusobacteriia bacterium 4572_74]
MDREKIRKKLNDGIIGRKKFFNSAVLASIIEIDGEYNFILEKRSKNIRQGGEISFPGGGWEKTDKNFEDTAVRETVEELGIFPENIEILGKLGTLIIPAGVLIEAYVGEILCKVENLNINIEEVDEILIVPIDYFRNNPPKLEKITVQMHPFCEVNGKRVEFPAKYYNLPEKYHKPWNGREREVYIYEYQGEVIWGITADIIYEIINKII